MTGQEKKKKESRCINYRRKKEKEKEKAFYKALKKKKSIERPFITTQMFKSFFHALGTYPCIPKITLFKILS